MELKVVFTDGTESNLQFDKGPIYIGRQMGSQIFLQDLSVSRQHAVIFADHEGTWFVEDLDSANKTYLNGLAIHKSHLKDGDEIKISNNTIVVGITDDTIAVEFETPDQPIHMEDTMVEIRHDITTIIRNFQSKKADPFHMSARRIGDFIRASATMGRADSIEKLHEVITELILSQLKAFRGWVALRKQIDGPMDIQSGRDITTLRVMRQELVMQQMISDALEMNKFQLVPQVPREMSKNQIRSVIAAPIIHDTGCHGVLYAENSTDHEHYNREDLDYLILLSIMASVLIQRL